MSRKRRILGALCAPVAACALLAIVPAGAIADLNPSGSPTVSGTDQVGRQLTCNNTTWSSTDGGSDGGVSAYHWYYATDTGHTTSLGTSQNYTPVAAAAGQGLECGITEQESGGTSATATAYSAATSAIVPLPSVTITQYSPTVTGNIGEGGSGVTVNLTLKRLDINQNLHTIAMGTATPNSSTGKWSAALTPAVAGPNDAFGLPGDELDVSYSGSGVTLPPNGRYSEPTGNPYVPFFLGGRSTISSDGTTVSSYDFNYPTCAGESFVINTPRVRARASLSTVRLRR